MGSSDRLREGAWSWPISSVSGSLPGFRCRRILRFAEIDSASGGLESDLASGDLEAGVFHPLGGHHGVVEDDLDRESVHDCAEAERQLFRVPSGELAAVLALPDHA